MAMKNKTGENAGAAIRSKEPHYSTWTEMKRHKTSYLMIAPYMILFFLFYVLPVLSSAVLSLTSFNLLQAPRFVGLMNYERMFLEDKIFFKIVGNTLLFAVVTGPIGYLLSFMLAWLINELGRKMRMFMALLFYSPCLLTNMYLMWTYVFSADSTGILNGALLSMGLIHEPVPWLSDARYMIPVLIVIQLWASMGAAFLAFIAGFQSQDRSLFEAGAIDGVRNRWQELWYISIPQLAPQLLFGAVMQISTAFSISTVVQALCGYPTTNYAADTIVSYMSDIATIRYEMGYASAIAVFLFTIMLLTNHVIRSILSKYSED